MSAEQDSLIQRVESSYRKLSTVASELNFVSDELGKCVSDLDVALKKLNLGVDVWVLIRGEHSESGSFWSEQLGYQKISGKWGIAIRTVSGHESDDGGADIEGWLFNDAPRSLRLSSIEKIPDLLDALSVEATRTSSEITKRVEDVKKVALAVTKSSEEPVKRIIARGAVQEIKK